MGLPEACKDIVQDRLPGEETGRGLGVPLPACRERLVGPAVQAQASQLSSISHCAGLGLQQAISSASEAPKPQSPWQQGTAEQRWL